MKIALYSDLHCEFGHDFKIDTGADVIILAGDIITFKDFEPLSKLLENVSRPVLYVAGNHEYYTLSSMNQGRVKLRKFLKENHPNVRFLQNQSVTIDGVNFFGGTMWTDFRNSNPMDMSIAHRGMNDFRYIKKGLETITPSDTVDFHKEYVKKLVEWFETDLSGPRVVISHHAPCVNEKGFHRGSNLQPAYNSLDMIKIILKYEPHYWVYGHTHESDLQYMKGTTIASNPRGYPLRDGLCECRDFDPRGLEFVV